MDHFKLSGLGFLAFSVSGFANAQNIYTDVADPDYYIRKLTVSTQPESEYFSLRGVSKEPTSVDVYSVGADSLNLKYGWKVYTEALFNNGGTYETWSGFVTQPTVVSDTEVVSHMASLIGTAYEGLTCSALLDAGFVSPCAIPPNVPAEVVNGTCRQWSLATGATSVLSGSMDIPTCFAQALALSVAQLDSLGITYNSPRISYAFCSSSTRLEFWIRYDGVPGQLDSYTRSGYFDASADGCKIPSIANPEPEQPATTLPSPLPSVYAGTDAELFDIVKPYITDNFIINSSTGKITYLNSGGFTAAQFASSYLQYALQGQNVPAGSASSSSTTVEALPAGTYTSSWASPPLVGDPAGPAPEPVPEPMPEPMPEPAPEPAPGTGALDCLVNWNTVACAAPDGFIADLVDSFWNSAIGTADLTEYDDFTLPTESVSGVLTPVTFQAGGGCPVPPSLYLSNGTEIVFDNAALCEGLAVVRPIVLVMALMSSLLILAGRGRS